VGGGEKGGVHRGRDGGGDKSFFAGGDRRGPPIIRGGGEIVRRGGADIGGWARQKTYVLPGGANPVQARASGRGPPGHPAGKIFFGRGVGGQAWGVYFARSPRVGGIMPTGPGPSFWHGPKGRAGPWGQARAGLGFHPWAGGRGHGPGGPNPLGRRGFPRHGEDFRGTGKAGVWDIGVFTKSPPGQNKPTPRPWRSGHTHTDKVGGGGHGGPPSWHPMGILGEISTSTEPPPTPQGHRVRGRFITEARLGFGTSGGKTPGVRPEWGGEYGKAAGVQAGWGKKKASTQGCWGPSGGSRFWGPKLGKTGRGGDPGTSIITEFFPQATCARSLAPGGQ